MLGVINDGQWEEINFLETAECCTRGGHFHRSTRELFLILKGTIRVRIRPEGSTEVRETLVRLCGAGSITCRFTHVYPDGPAPYYSMLAPARRGGELELWDEVKRVAGEIILGEGGTITHHHAVGRDHRSWFDRERPDGFARVLRAAKAELDPAWVLNPGVLFDRNRDGHRTGGT